MILVIRLHPALIEDIDARAALANVFTAIEAGEARESIAEAIKVCLAAGSANIEARIERIERRHELTDAE